jgi:hypothetical protein
MKKNNDFGLLLVLLIGIPLLIGSFFVGSWLQNMSLWDRAMIFIPIFLIILFFVLTKK